MRALRSLTSRRCRSLFRLIAIAALLPRVAGAQWWSFEPRSYYDPLIAGVREPHVSALAVAWADRMAFLQKAGDPRRVWDIDLGTEMPLAGWESGPGIGGRAPEGGWGVGIWLPIDFHMVEDFVDDSSPILNTDYRFGAMLKLQCGLVGDRWLGLRAFLGHESTHLGDELSVVAQRTDPAHFERVNVSWEYLDLGAVYERMSGTRTWSARLGATATLPFRDSYYSIGAGSVTQSPLGPVTPSVNWVDPYLGLQAEWEDLLGGAGVGWSAYASAELRWRSVYDYHKADPAAPESRQLSLNLLAGLARTGTIGNLGRVSPFVRLYHGVNPHGQFRNQRSYCEYGIGLRLRR